MNGCVDGLMDVGWVLGPVLSDVDDVVVIGKLIKPQRLVFPLCSLVFLSSLPVIVLHNKVSKFLISHILSFPITCPV